MSCSPTGCSIPAGDRICVEELAEWPGFRQPTVDHHLKFMAEAGILERDQRGTSVRYSVSRAGLRRVREIVY
ncbi:ArsR/SmtB family transcription factor [Streptomyces coeruleorubidus]|uniref:ArsR/SmtB family transcription factor n=1 Tax=Streptomyces coeruleorubidus TaxID=116188 RepID=UPI0033CA3095